MKVASWSRSRGTMTIEPAFAERFSILPESYSLVMKNVQIQDTAVYQCWIRNANDTASSLERTVNVNIIGELVHSNITNTT